MISATKHNVVSRLVLAKAMLARGRAQLRSPDPISWGMSVSAAQDGVELLLRAAAEIHNVNVRSVVGFEELLVALSRRLEETGRGGVPNLHAIRRLNKARVDFKHHGEIPTQREASGLVSVGELFCEDASERLLDIEWSYVSRADAIERLRARYWIKKAEQSLEASEYEDSIRFSAIATATLLGGIGDISDPSRRYLTKDADAQLARLAWWSDKGPLSGPVQKIVDELTAVRRAVNIQRQLLNIASMGVDLSDFWAVELRSPVIAFDYNMAPQVMRSGPRNLSRDDASFCLNFALKTCARVGEAILVHFQLPDHFYGRFRAARVTRVLGSVPSEEYEEVVGEISAGTEMLGRSLGGDNKWYQVKMLGEELVVLAEDIEPIHEDSGDAAGAGVGHL